MSNKKLEDLPMRTQVFVVALALGAVLVTGCKDDDSAVDPTSSVSLATDDAADAIASALGGSEATSGLTTQIEELASVTGGGSLGKVDGALGISVDTTFTRQRTGTYAYSYSYHYNFSLVNANQFSFTFTMHGMYETPRMASNDSSNGVFQVSNLLIGQNYLIAGTYNRYGSQASKVRNQVQFRSNLVFSTQDLQVDKNTHRVTSGTATITFYGQSSTGNAFAYTATVTFMGNRTATMAMAGKTYTLNLALGQAD